MRFIASMNATVQSVLQSNMLTYRTVSFCSACDPIHTSTCNQGHVPVRNRSDHSFTAEEQDAPPARTSWSDA